MTARTWLVLSVASISGMLSGCKDDPVGTLPEIIVENASSVSIAQVFIRDCPVKFWGENRLEANQAIEPGERHPFDLGSGCYDLLVYFETNRTSDRHNLEVPDGQPVLWTVNHPAF